MADTRYCYTQHTMEVTGNSISVTKRCVPLEECLSTGCRDSEHEGYKVWESISSHCPYRILQCSWADYLGCLTVFTRPWKCTRFSVCFRIPMYSRAKDKQMKCLSKGGADDYRKPLFTQKSPERRGSGTTLSHLGRAWQTHQVIHPRKQAAVYSDNFLQSWGCVTLLGSQFRELLHWHLSHRTGDKKAIVLCICPP